LLSDPIVYHMYRVTNWEGGEPSILGDEARDLIWKTLADAAHMPDLALQEYRHIIARLG
jgi:8-oxo-dGTP diphosphatase